ncbi:hypothetical protein [Bacillus cereus]|uniref:hypothetical protein n=1 Tax=Bacillus cereus TaxID=1396 RepID=UPI0035C78445
MKKFAAVAMASTLFFGWSGSSTFASPNTESVSQNVSVNQNKDMKSTFKKMNDIANTTKEIQDSQRIQDIKIAAENSISSGKVVLKHSDAQLDFNNAKFLDISQDNKSYKSITIPIVGEQYSFISNLTVIFDLQGEVSNYSETLVTKSENNKFEITSYLDGELGQSQVTNVDYKNNSEVKKSLERINAQGIKADEPQYSMGAVAACIAAVAGVDIAVAYVIGGTCAASCPAVPPVCAACIGAVATLGAGSIAGVVACFSKL